MCVAWTLHRKPWSAVRFAISCALLLPFLFLVNQPPAAQESLPVSGDIPISVAAIKTICRQCRDLRDNHGNYPIHKDLDRLDAILALDQMLKVKRAVLSNDQFQSGQDNAFREPFELDSDDRAISHATAEYTSTSVSRLFWLQPPVAHLVNVSFPASRGKDTMFNQWTSLTTCVRNSAMQQLAFMYPERMLLLCERPLSDDVCQAWWNELKGKDSSRWWLTKKYRLINVPDAPPTSFTLLDPLPRLNARQWKRFKCAVRKRWETDIGTSVASHICLHFGRYHNLERLVMPPATTLAKYDLRGFHFTKEAYIGSFDFQDVDLWNASFQGCHGAQSGFTGAKVIDCEFSDCLLPKARFIGDAKQLGPSYSAFSSCSLTSTYWKDCRLTSNVFFKCDLSNARFYDCNLANVWFLSCNMDGVTFQGSTLGEGCRIINCALKDIEFGGAPLRSDLFVPFPTTGTMAQFAQLCLFDRMDISPSEDSDEFGYISRMNPEREPDVLRWMDCASKKARFGTWTKVWYHLFALPPTVDYYICQEEREGWNGFQEYRDFVEIQSQIVNNYRDSGRFSRYKEEWLRLQCPRPASISENGTVLFVWQSFDGLTTKHGTSVLRFFATMFLLLLFYRLYREKSDLWRKELDQDKTLRRRFGKLLFDKKGLKDARFPLCLSFLLVVFAGVVDSIWIQPWADVPIAVVSFLILAIMLRQHEGFMQRLAFPLTAEKKHMRLGGHVLYAWIIFELFRLVTTWTRSFS